MRLVVVFLVACVSSAPQGPTAIARFVEPAAWSKDDVSRIERGLAVWERLGFITAVEEPSTLPPCPNDWFKRTPQLVNCVLVLTVRKEADMISTYNHYAQTDRVTDVITIDDTVHGERLTNVFAHEAGHSLLNTREHTTYGSMAPGGDYAFVSGADRKLACKAIGRGCPE